MGLVRGVCVICVLAFPGISWAGGFLDSCLQKDADPDLARTVDSLMDYVQAETCDDANTRLQAIDQIGPLGYSSVVVCRLEPFSDLAALQVLEVQVSCEQPYEIDLAQLSGASSLFYVDLTISNDSPFTRFGDFEGLCHLPSLTHLSLTSREASSETRSVAPLAGLFGLRALNLDIFPDLSDVSTLGSLTSLEYLGLPGAGIEDLSFVSNLSSLEVLDVGSNRISDVESLRSLFALRFLNISYNNVSDLEPLQDLEQMTVLFAAGNQITDTSPLGGLHLAQLDLSQNLIENFVANPLDSLEELYLRGNAISNLESFSAYPRLSFLDLSLNSVRDISDLAAIAPNLWMLDLNHNDIKDLSPLDDFELDPSSIFGWLLVWAQGNQVQNLWRAGFLQDAVRFGSLVGGYGVLGLEDNPIPQNLFGCPTFVPNPTVARFCSAHNSIDFEEWSFEEFRPRAEAAKEQMKARLKAKKKDRLASRQ